MISKTADPGQRNWALARLEVCTEMKTPVSEMTCNCSLKEVVVLNSTTRTCSDVCVAMHKLRLPDSAQGGVTKLLGDCLAECCGDHKKPGRQLRGRG